MSSTEQQQPQPQSAPSAAPPAPSGGADNLPEQRHAGQVGYGPNYHAGASLEDKMAGLKEEIAGKLTHNPDRVRHGHELISGEEKRKKLTGEGEPSPFASAAGPDEGDDTSTASDTKKTPDTSNSKLQLDQSNGTDNARGSPNVKATPSGMAVDHGSGPGAKEQAATVAPEGTHAANVQKEGGAVDRTKNIDARQSESIN